jgi:acyl carrier protein
LDSMGFALLLDHLEATFQIQAEDNDLIESNFESINAITDFVIRKKAQVT